MRLAGRLDRKHTLSVLYNLVKEHKDRDTIENLSMRKLLIAANWKMYKTPTEAQSFLAYFSAVWSKIRRGPKS